MKFNWATATDSYKVTHWKQYPPGTEHVYSYFEARRPPPGFPDEIVFFGLQYLLREYVARRVTEADVKEARSFWRDHFGADHFNLDGWMHIVRKHDGVLPLEIRAVAEGTVVPNSNVLFTVVNTDPAVPWLTNWVETVLTQVWYPITVASRGRVMKATLRAALERTGDPSSVDFKLHDFGFRGVSSFEQAAIGGAAHLLNFRGTDTAPGIHLLRTYYGAAPDCGVSIPASEHSTITAWGPGGECAAFANMLEQYPTGLVACVSDSYDIEAACVELWGGALREKVLARDGTLVVRPDSGELPGALLSVLEMLGERFGTSLNPKGFRVLPPKVRVIQGDGITTDMVGTICAALESRGWSVDNIALGSGGGLLQKLDRDTYSHAFKASAIRINGEWRDVYKDPVAGGKTSKRGRLKLVCGPSGAVQTLREEDRGKDLLREVFRDGSVLLVENIAGIRERAK